MRRAAASALGTLIAATALLLGAGGAVAAPAAATPVAAVPLPAAAATPGSPAETPPGADPSASPGSDQAPAESAPPGAEPAAGTATEVVRARVRTGAGEDLAGVAVSVEQDGQEVAAGETDAQGTADLPVPAPGDYEVLLDVDALPDAAADLQPRQNPITTTVEAGQTRTVAFRLEEAGAAAGAEAAGGSTRVLQLVANGLRFGLVVALAAIGLSLIFGTTGLTNFAHSELITFGALTTYLFNVVAGLPVLLAAVLGIAVSGAFGWLNDRGLWQPLRRRGTGLIAMMIVSIGLSLFLRYLFLFLFGGDSANYVGFQGQAGVDLLGLGLVRLRPVDVVSMAVSAVVLVVVALALLRTRLGKATRAVSDNPALASASGIDVDRVIRTVWIVGAALAGLSGIMLGLQQGLSFQMGFQILLLVFAAVTLGGLGTAFGAILGSIVVGVFVEVSTLVVPTELRNVGALAILIIILLVRPQGILGRAQRVG
ncbi:branched-chain amino acid ABC transporter permease [Quadrisphaera sp. DSM 44207]|uniref:branched-chain amino acid ABC transporter permease n=1 Tax=Quadrisphaera sp. DSM 44207 TaxID=1881057 RepID=UPI000881D200|nr:branched-chain amino acid ABC transporter permease [Quadrisphaera sp. DSM 44207]SDQ45051.1 branched-chain amino acid transport system permease protein [Quadrisphaera sp. DSM 44207]